MILHQARATIERHAMLIPSDRIVVAVSGGPDSVALLHILVEISREMSLTLIVAHLDHRLRGEASEADRRFVEDLAHELHLPFECASVDVAALARGEKRSLEEAGRVARRRFLHQVAARLGARRVALGHHRDDQAESVLLRLFAGAGRGGLSGMKPIGAGLFIRPFFDCSREAILAYLAERGIPYRTDASNEDLRFPRNRLRQRLLPMIRDEFNPRVAEAIARTADLLRDEDAYLEARARRALKGLVLEGDQPNGVDTAVIDAVALSSLPPPIGRRALRLALRRAGLTGRDLAQARIGDILELAARSGSNRDLSPGGGLCVRLEYGRLIIAGTVPPIDTAPSGGHGPLRSPDAEGMLLALPGTLTVREGDFTIQARLLPLEAVAEAFPHAPPSQAYLDADRLGEAVLVRPARLGDRFHPLGAPGRRKLSDFFTDIKLPREARRRALVVESGGDVVWVAGLRISHTFRVTESTRRVALLDLSSGARTPWDLHEGNEGREEAQVEGAGAGSADRPPALPRTPAAPHVRVLYTAEEIAGTVERLAKEVSAWIAGRETLVLGILQGSFVFMADLVRRIEGPITTGFLDRAGNSVSGELRLAGARILLVEDILDTGESLARTLGKLRGGGAVEVRSCVLFDKPSGRNTPIEADYRGLLVPDRWVVGFGLDHQGTLRNLPFLSWV